jgi:hypothetical protein
LRRKWGDLKMPKFDIENCNYVSTDDFEFQNVTCIELFIKHDILFIGFYDENKDYYIFRFEDVNYVSRVTEE